MTKLDRQEEQTITSVLSGRTVGHVSDGEFDEEYLSTYPYGEQLLSCLEQAIQELADEPYFGRKTNARVMGHAMGLLRSIYDLNAPRGWVPIMKRLRKTTDVEPMLPLRQLGWLKPPEAPYWYLQNRQVTENEFDLIMRLTRSDYDTYPAMYEVRGFRVEDGCSEAVAG